MPHPLSVVSVPLADGSRGATSIEAQRTVELQRERSRQERLEAELAAELARQRADQERQRMDQERIEAERMVLQQKCEEQERQRMDQERIEAELGGPLNSNDSVWSGNALRRLASPKVVRCWTPMPQSGSQLNRRRGADASRERRGGKKAGAEPSGVA